MANSITKFKKYIGLLDEVYKVASVTSILDGNNRLVRMGANTNEIIIPKMSMDGLADYSRENGYVGGDVTLTNETVKFNYERGRSFNIDAMRKPRALRSVSSPASLSAPRRLLRLTRSVSHSMRELRA